MRFPSLYSTPSGGGRHILTVLRRRRAKLAFSPLCFSKFQVRSVIASGHHGGYAEQVSRRDREEADGDAEMHGDDEREVLGEVQE